MVILFVFCFFASACGMQVPMLPGHKGIERYLEVRPSTSPRLQWLIKVLANDPDNKIFSPRPVSSLIRKEPE